MMRIIVDLWSRPLWMRLAACSGGCAILVLMVAGDRLRLAAQLQFMHAMATFACATIMNIGGTPARAAPAFFLAGTALFCGSAYAAALGAPDVTFLLQPLGAAAFLAGWGVLVWAAGSIAHA